MTAGWRPRTRRDIARLVARDIQEGWVVNLGIGMPTLVADEIPAGREVVLHSENGIVGMGPAPAAGQVDPWLVNASRAPVTLRAGAALVHQADSFAIVRGGHLDLCVLGAFEVAENGDLANWSRAETDDAPSVGGAMDLASGARRVWVMTEHNTADGRPKLVERCGLALTAPGCVSRVYTSLATIEVVAGGFAVLEMVDGLDFETLEARTGARLRRPA